MPELVSFADIAGYWLGIFLTFCILSFLYKDNPFYKFAEHLFIGISIGYVIIQQYYNAGYGNRVILANGVKRGKSIVTTYNHLSRFARGSGAKVSRGEVIGYVGSTGYSTGCHLHFMVLANGGTTNPMSWL